MNIEKLKNYVQQDIKSIQELERELDRIQTELSELRKDRDALKHLISKMENCNHNRTRIVNGNIECYYCMKTLTTVAKCKHFYTLDGKCQDCGKPITNGES